MRSILKTIALPVAGGLVLISGVTITPNNAEAGRLGRAVGTAVVVGTAKATTRRANAANRYDRNDEDSDNSGTGEVKAVDHEARAREAKAKLAAEAAASKPFFVPASSPTALPVEERKAVCIAGC